ncbi:extracellular matrix regulator RemB [Bacillus sp. FJAT-27445]|uniref:extracellular matrix regulator RemB n=1 Tax=Bacillus sp. FJAT-27445 TaxID=1679166 RepID=UPI000743952B|nr:extracellular matrix/biofilm biosynthesis regulator RemA family protein [Bacillus sp. FJAT-27445]
MYIHIGEDHMIRARDIIAIIDKESAGISNLAESAQVTNLSKGPFKSVVVTGKEVYLSPLASSTLKKRSARTGIHDF